MKISHKLILSFLLVASLTSVTTFFTLQSYSEINKALSQLIDHQTNIIESLNDLKQSVLQIISSTSEYALIHREAADLDKAEISGLDKTEMLEEEQQLIESGRQTLETSLNRYEELVGTVAPDEAATLVSVRAASSKLVNTSSEIIALKKHNISGKDILEKKEEFETDESVFLKYIEDALKKETEEQLREKKNVQSTIALATRETLGLTALSFILAIFSGIYVSLLISRNLEKLKIASRKVGSGELDTQIEINSKDEIGDLARSFNKMIDNLKESRAELASAKLFTEKVLESMIDFVVVTDMELTITQINKAALKINGYEEHELIGKSVNMLMADRPFNRKGVDILRRNNFIADLNKICLNKDGSLTPILMSMSVLKDDQNNEIGFVCVGKDVSQRRREEMERQAITEIVQSMITTTGLDELFKVAYQAINRLISAENCYIALHDPATGLIRYEFWGDKVRPVPEPHPVAKNFGGYVLETRQPLLLTEELKQQLYQSGAVEMAKYPPSWMGVPLRLAATTIGILVIQDYEKHDAYSMRDLEMLSTIGDQLALAIERQRAQEALALENSLMQALMDNIPDAIYFKDTESRFLRASKHTHLRGIKSPEEAVGKTAFDFYSEECARNSIEDDQGIVQTGQPLIDKEEMEIFLDGSNCWVLTTKVPLFDAKGNVTGIVGTSRDITERKKVEEALRKETALVELLKTVAIAANESDSVEDAVQICLNEVCQLMKWQFGHAALPVKASPDELITMPIWYRDDEQRFQKVKDEMKDVRFQKGIGLIGRVLESGKAIWIRDVTKDTSFTKGKLAKEVGFKAGFAFPILWQNKVLGVLTFFSETVEDPDEKVLEVMTSIGTQLGQAIARKQAEEALSENEAKFRDLFDNAPIAYHEIDINGCFIRINRTEELLLGYSSEELKGRHPSEIIVEKVSREAVAAKLAGKMSLQAIERTFIRKDGSLVSVLNEDRLIYDTDGQVTGIRSTLQDITERKRVEEEIRQSEEKYRNILENMEEGYFEADLNGDLTFFNDALSNSLGYSRDELMGLSYKDYVDEESANKNSEIFKDIYTTNQSRIIPNWEMIRKDGEHRVHESSVSLIQNATNEPIGFRGLVRDITERKQTEIALRESEEQFRLLVEGIKDYAILMLDKQGRIVSWNKSAELIKGYQADEIIGQHFSRFYTSEDLQDGKPEQELIIAQIEGKYEEEGWRVRKDGTLFWANVLITAIWDEMGELRGFSKITRDITERKRIEEEVLQSRDAALESARLKSEFLANMSPEIRTPMNGVIGMTGLLLDTDLTEEQRDFAQTVQSSADALLRIIDDILDFSKIEAGQLHFEKIDFYLNECIESPIELLAERAYSKGIEIASLIYQDVPTQLSGDPGRLRQILTNLIGNAVKFTETGEVTVSVQKQNETEKFVSLRFEVTDTGIGISEQAQSRLFRAFTQADGSTTRKYGGTGLGLAISKQLVELMNGEIGIESIPGKGSTFWFTARFEKQPNQTSTIQPIGNVSLEGVRVLIVDDNATNRKIFLHQTTSWEMIAAEAGSGEKALELLRTASKSKEPFEIAILDLMMPEMDGFELARLIKSDPALSGTHLVIQPSYGKRGDGQIAREFGIAAYLQKPVRQSQLYNCLMTVMAEASGHSSDQLPNLITQHSLRSATALPNNKPPLKALKARILVAEDNAVNRKVALSQLKSLGYTADVVTNGREAVKAIEKYPYKVILMDCQMPEMDGFEATAEIRRLEGDTSHMTIIAMTAHALEGERKKCLAAGMDDYISKPVKLETLKQSLDQWLIPSLPVAPPVAADEQVTAGAKAVNDSSVAAAKNNNQSVDLSVLTGLRDLQQPDEPDIMTELIDLFLEDAGKRLKTLRKAAAGQETGKIREEAHSIKGSSSNIGARHIAALCARLEEEKLNVSETEAIVTEIDDEFQVVTRILIEMRESAEPIG